MHLVEHKRVRTEYQHPLKTLADSGYQVRLARARRMHHTGAVCGLKSLHHLLVRCLVMIIELGSHIADICLSFIVDGRANQIRPDNGQRQNL